MRRSFPVVPVLVAAIATAGGASAQTLPSIDARTWRASTDPRAGLVLEPVVTPGPGELAVAAWIHYTQNPLTLRAAGTSDVAARPIASMLGAEVTAAVGLGAIAMVGVSVPVVLYQDGTSGLPATVVANGAVPSSGLGDLALHGKVTLVDNERRRLGGFGLAATSTVTLPTGDRAGFLGEGAVTVNARLHAEYNVLVVRAHASLGYLVRGERRTWPDASVGGVTFGDALPWSFGFTFRPGIPLKALDRDDRQVWELALHGSLPAGPVGPFGSGDPGSARLSPVLLAVSDRIAIGKGRDFFAVIGVDVGLNDAIGVPAFRGIVAVGWAPREHDKDHDGIPDDVDRCDEQPEDFDGIEDEDGCPEDDADDDGVVDHLDACPLVKGLPSRDPKKNGCPAPDADGDGIADAEDACPNEKGPRTNDPKTNGCPPVDPATKTDRDHDGIADAFDACPDVAGVAEKHGCPLPDRDGDGIADDSDACPDVKGEASADPTRNGCPNTDRDGDTFPNDVDACPDEPETFNGVKDEDGCPDTGGAPLVVLDAAAGTIKLARPLRFVPPARGHEKLGPALDEASVMTLRALALELNRHRDWFVEVAARPGAAGGGAEAIVDTLRALTAATYRPAPASVLAWDAVKQNAARGDGIALRLIVRGGAP